MAESVTLKVNKREGRGTRLARRLRKQGHVPGVLYGHGEATISVVLPADDLVKAIRHGARVVDLDQGGALEKALIRDLQWDPLGHDIVHVDFARVAADERIEVDVRLELRGTAPGVTAGGRLDQPLHNLEVECLAISIPESIRVNIGELQIGSVIHVRDLKLPEGVIARNDPDAVVVQVTEPMADVEAPETALPGAEPQSAEPEVIGRQKAEKEEEAEE
ncbi:MAG: 50S ribosomal protein L25 [Planctomycetes bacterium]|nr:50S ribosomal protein L25 [Planctomycetota bacterium]